MKDEAKVQLNKLQKLCFLPVLKKEGSQIDLNLESIIVPL